MAPTQSPQDSSFADILEDAFNAPSPNGDFSILQALKSLHAGEHTRHIALVDNTSCPAFPLSGYLLSKGVKVEIMPEPLHELVHWDATSEAGSNAGLDPEAAANKGELVPRLITGSLKFSYKATDFLVYKVSWPKPFGQSVTLFDIVFEDPEYSKMDAGKDGQASTTTPGHNLISDVYRWAGALKDEMWVFQGGFWAKDKSLWIAIRDASWDDIVLEQDFLEGLRRDTRTFFGNRKIYKDLGVVWKRGLLLLGPPGNGKTESIKVLLKESGQAALYVKSFTTPDGPELGVRRIFDHARANAPCILVIEDLDSLVTSSVRSFFLNELDGIGQNEGILTIATTNHPERIDDAILNRPSRFDVKYNFGLPTEQLRETYAFKWIRKIAGLITQDDARPIVQFAKGEAQLAKEVAKETNDWSFAFLKELQVFFRLQNLASALTEVFQPTYFRFLSFLLRIAHDEAKALSEGKETRQTSVPADSVLMDQITALSSQIVRATTVDGNGESSVESSPNVQVPTRATRRAMPAARLIGHSGTNF